MCRRKSCKSSGSDDGTSEQALPENSGSEVHSRDRGRSYSQFFVMSDAAEGKRRVKEQSVSVSHTFFERLGRVLSQTSSRKVVPAMSHWHRSQSIPRQFSPGGS